MEQVLFLNGIFLASKVLSFYEIMAYYLNFSNAHCLWNPRHFLYWSTSMCMLVGYQQTDRQTTILMKRKQITDSQKFEEIRNFLRYITVLLRPCYYLFCDVLFCFHQTLLSTWKCYYILSGHGFRYLCFTCTVFSANWGLSIQHTAF